MLSRLKQYFWIAVALAIFYFLLSHHIIISSYDDYDFLKKKELSMKYTFYKLNASNVFEALRIEVLREAGIEDVIRKKGLVSEERLEQFIERNE
jgi:hypothetical protein